MKKQCITGMLLLSILLSGCGLVASDPEVSTQSTAATVLPENAIQVGDTFEYCPKKADGHFTCSVTDVRVVAEEAQCPPKEQFLETHTWGYKNGKEIIFDYDQWFTEGGAFDLGVRLILVDLTVTNVDAIAWLDNGTFYGDCGYFYEPDVFPAHEIVQWINFSNIYGEGKDQYYFGDKVDYFSRTGEFCEEDITDTLGTEPFAIQIKPGETISFTVGYILHGERDGTPQDLSTSYLGIGNTGSYFVDRGSFIKLNLGEE